MVHESYHSLNNTKGARLATSPDYDQNIYDKCCILEKADKRMYRNDIILSDKLTGVAD